MDPVRPTTTSSMLPQGISLPPSLEHAKVSSLPPSAYYIPDFISEDEEQFLLDKIANAPKPRWKQLTHRRLQTWPSDLVKDALVDGPLPQWLEAPVVSRLLSIPSSPGAPHIFASSPHSRPNHVLINEYPPKVGIMPHKVGHKIYCAHWVVGLTKAQDGAAYHPIVCTVSLGSSLCLDIYRSKDGGALEPQPAWRILQEPRSLLITTADIYSQYLHGIADIEEDVDLNEHTIVNWSLLRSHSNFDNGRNVRQTRTSLTYRDVLKVSRLGNKLGMFLKR